VEVVIVGCPDEAGALVGGAIAALLRARPAAVLGVATGSSPLVVYRDLARRHAAGEVSFAQARAFLLDEYVGLGPDHPQSYRRFVAEHVEAGVDFGPGRVRGPDATAADLPAACTAYEAAIAAAGGVDLQLLGIGGDGHIAFNEPGSSLASRTRIKTLTARTREDNARFFASAGDVPHHVLTQGVGTILEARHLVLLAFGPTKADAVARAVEGPVTAMVPASALQLHPHVTVAVDEPAAAGLALADHYRETWRGKPAWQGL
jgi:glucosamine-6-phosphate deaminase